MHWKTFSTRQNAQRTEFSVQFFCRYMQMCFVTRSNFPDKLLFYQHKNHGYFVATFICQLFVIDRNIMDGGCLPPVSCVPIGVDDFLTCLICLGHLAKSSLTHFQVFLVRCTAAYFALHPQIYRGILFRQFLREIIALEVRRSQVFVYHRFKIWNLLLLPCFTNTSSESNPHSAELSA